MFCVVQEVEVKTVPEGEPKGIEVYELRWAADGKEFCSYEYCNSAERFERPIKKSYRISIHESYRENGREHNERVNEFMEKYGVTWSEYNLLQICSP